MKLFPTIEEVFSNPLPIYKTIFFPLVTINLGEDMDKKEGKVHFISVLGDAYPYLIKDGERFEWDFIRFDWDGTHYQFDNSVINMEETAPLLEWYASIEEDYNKHKSEYLKNHSWEEARDSHLEKMRIKRRKISHDLYMYADMLLSYWITRDKYLETGLFIRDYGYYGLNDQVNKPVIILSKTGITNRSDELVGKVCEYNYLTYGEDEIKLSIDRKKQQIIQKFYWS
jgi:hypothetical protein